MAQYDNESTDPTCKAVRYKVQEACKEQVERHAVVKVLNENLHPDWWKELVIPDQGSAFGDKCFQECLNTLNACGIAPSGQLEQ